MKSYREINIHLTCQQAVYIQVTHSLNTDSLIEVLIRIVAHSRNVRQIGSDNGSNFARAEQELLKAFSEMDNNKIENYLQDHGEDWITWKKNPTAARPWVVLGQKFNQGNYKLPATDKGHGLDEEFLQTLITETETIINSCSLTVEAITNGQSRKPISSINILTMKTKVVMSPQRVFQKLDLYCRSRWRRIQDLSNQFWSWWRKEFIKTFLDCDQWVKMSRNFCIGDIVLLKTDLTTQNLWPMCKFIKTNSDDKRVVQSVKLLLGNSGNRDGK